MRQDWTYTRLRRFLAPIFASLAEPKTDIIDLAGVALGKSKLACLLMRESAIREGVFRRLVASIMAEGFFVADLNGNIGLSAEYSKSINMAHLPVWLVTRSADLLLDLVNDYRALQPQGKGLWEMHLGRALGYPECCIARYSKAAARSDGVVEYWHDIRKENETTPQILLGFGVCRAGCPRAVRPILDRLDVAAELGLLNHERASRWLNWVAPKADMRSQWFTPIRYDLSDLIPIRIPVSWGDIATQNHTANGNRRVND